MGSIHPSANIFCSKHQDDFIGHYSDIGFGRLLRDLFFFFFFGSLSRMGLSKLLPTIVISCLCLTVNAVYEKIFNKAGYRLA